MDKKRLWIVSELFYPEETSTSYILTEIANKLVEKYDVYVICGPEEYEKGKKFHDANFTLNCNVSLTRISCFSFNKNNILNRILRLVILSFNLFWTLKKNIKTGDRVFIVTNPAPMLLLISFLRKKKKFNLAILIHDVFPENAISAKVLHSKKSLIYKILKSFFDKAYSRADLLVVLGRDMKDVIFEKVSQCGKIPKIEILENWADLINIQPIIKEDICKDDDLLSSKIVFQYAGNLGRVQGLMELLEIVGESINKSIHYSFWGDGAMKETMKLFVRNRKLHNVSIHGGYARNEQNVILNSCDIAIVTLAEGMYGLGVPSKVYNIMAAGKPILYIGDKRSEVFLMIYENNIGFCFEPTEKEELILFLDSISIADMDKFKKMGSRAYNLAREKYSKEAILNKYLDLL